LDQRFRITDERAIKPVTWNLFGRWRMFEYKSSRSTFRGFYKNQNFKTIFHHLVTNCGLNPVVPRNKDRVKVSVETISRAKEANFSTKLN